MMNLKPRKSRLTHNRMRKDVLKALHNFRLDENVFTSRRKVRQILKKRRALTDRPEIGCVIITSNKSWINE